MVPGVLGSSPDEGLLSLETLVLMVLFSLMAFVVVAFGVLALRKQPNSSDKALDSAANSAARVPSERVSEYKIDAARSRSNPAFFARLQLDESCR